MKHKFQFLSFSRLVSFSCLLTVTTQVISFGAEHHTRKDRNQLGNICEELQKKLIDTGFENVSVAHDSAGAIAISYENRLYRNELSALGKVLSFASFYSEQVINLRIIIKRQDLPIIALQIKSADWQDFISEHLSTRDFAERLVVAAYDEADENREDETQLVKGNSSSYKTDVVLQPIVDAQLGDYQEPYKFKIGFNLGLSTLFARGLNLEVRTRVPVLDEIDPFVKESIHLHSASINYLSPVAKNTFLSTHLGYFSGERYGISSQAVRYFLSGNLALAARADYTGFLTYFDKKWFYSGLNRWTYNLGASWQFSPYGFRASVQYGKYLLGDRGVRVALGRYLNESRLDFFAIATTGDHWVGVELGIPLFPNKKLRPSRLRLNTPNLHVVRYDYLTTDFGQTFNLPYDLLEFRSNLTKNYIVNHLEDLRRHLPATPTIHQTTK